MTYTLPDGYTLQKSRGGLIAVHDELGQPLIYAADEDAATRCLYCLPQYGGAVSSTKQRQDYVEL